MRDFAGLKVTRRSAPSSIPLVERSWTFFTAAEDFYSIISLDQHSIGGCTEDCTGYSGRNIADRKCIRIFTCNSADFHAVSGFPIKFTGINNIYIRTRSHAAFKVYRNRSEWNSQFRPRSLRDNSHGTGADTYNFLPGDAVLFSSVPEKGWELPQVLSVDRYQRH